VGPFWMPITTAAIDATQRHRCSQPNWQTGR
jgi:hypothetical protein